MRRLLCRVLGHRERPWTTAPAPYAGYVLCLRCWTAWPPRRVSILDRAVLS